MDYFSKKRIIVVGATGAFGQLVAQRLRELGADPLLVSRGRQPLPSDLTDLPSAVADVTSREQVSAALSTLAAGQPVDGIINCAGVVAFGSFAEVSAEVTRELFAVNSEGVINLISLAGDVVAPGGFLASFTGVAADMTIMGMGAYCASKTAAKSALAIAARELRSKKISVLDIRAPHTETGLVTRALAGTAPTMPAGLDPAVVVERVLTALAAGEKDLPAEAFSA